MTSSGYFDDLYAADRDPWKLASSEYEKRKLGLVLASLPAPRYSRAFEPGCAIGVTTAALAGRCDHVLAMDCAVAAVRQARLRTRGLAVTVVSGSIPDDWPEGAFDLVVLSELLYYLDDHDRSAVADRAGGCLSTGGDLLAVHWRLPFDEATVTGDEAHGELVERLAVVGPTRSVAHVEQLFRLEVFHRDE